MKAYPIKPLIFVTLLAGSSLPPSTTAFASKTSASKSSQSNPVAPTDTVFREEQITLPTTGIIAQVISAAPKKSTGKPPLLFLHGSFHGAWCWQEHWMPYFVDHGFPCVALSWRGTGGTPAEEGAKKVKILEHCQDLQGLLDVLPTILAAGGGSGATTNPLSPPVLVAHSMGGIYVQKYLEEQCTNNSNNNGVKPSDLFSGIVTFCSTPPSGNGPATLRVLRRSLRDAYRITVGFVLKKVTTDASICRDCFFGGPVECDEDGNVKNDHGVSDDDVARYQTYFALDSQVVLDVSDLSKRLPSKQTNEEGRASFVADLPPCLVVGAQDDFIVDEVGNRETAKYYGLDEPVFVDSPHDVMLGKNWRNGALVLKEWLEKEVSQQ